MWDKTEDQNEVKNYKSYIKICLTTTTLKIKIKNWKKKKKKNKGKYIIYYGLLSQARKYQSLGSGFIKIISQYAIK